MKKIYLLLCFIALLLLSGCVDGIEEKKICTLKVECKTILDNIDNFNIDKKEIIPDGGIIYAENEVEFIKGESCFDVLKREMIKNNIHLEFSSTPIYNSIYIEGINNIYEFDCGELSGWMYKVNGEVLNLSCSEYLVEENDLIEFVYTCNLGRDIKKEMEQEDL